MAIGISAEFDGTLPALDFDIKLWDGRTVKITLPVIGEATVPTGIIAAVGAWQDAMNGSNQDQARVLYMLLESVRGAFPEQGRVLWSLPHTAVEQFFTAWLNASIDSGFDPKARDSSSSDQS